MSVIIRYFARFDLIIVSESELAHAKGVFFPINRAISWLKRKYQLEHTEGCMYNNELCSTREILYKAKIEKSLLT